MTTIIRNQRFLLSQELARRFDLQFDFSNIIVELSQVTRFEKSRPDIAATGSELNPAIRFFNFADKILSTPGRPK
jgi:hypothetical protein